MTQWIDQKCMVIKGVLYFCSIIIIIALLSTISNAATPPEISLYEKLKDPLYVWVAFFLFVMGITSISLSKNYQSWVDRLKKIEDNQEKAAKKQMQTCMMITEIMTHCADKHGWKVNEKYDIEDN